MGQVDMASLAELLRELKERSGLSYGVLAKRLHMSASTVHRYCNGDAVPTDFAPVERFARLCGVTPEELMEIHRRWILADADRGRKAAPPAPPRPTTPATPTAPETATPTAPEPAPPEPAPPETAPPETAPAEPHHTAPRPTPHSAPSPAPDQPRHPAPEAPAPVPPASPPPPPPPRRRRTLVLAAVVVAVVAAGSVALALSDRGGDRGGDRRAGGAATPSDRGAPPSRSPGEGGDSGAPLTARTRPYAYDHACDQDFLVNRKAGEVPERPLKEDWPGWVGDLGAVSAGSQRVEVTVQGTGKDTVVLQDMNVRVQSTGAPLEWSAFGMGSGCHGRAPAEEFRVDLDEAAPGVRHQDGRRDFPYKVSENDREVFHVTAATRLHDVRWYLEIEWSSGTRHDVLRVDDQGKPFRTSGDRGRPRYEWNGGWKSAQR
ncbi:helix-turn-helix transcriptional regulator [Streptomyces sp. NPDC047123]|uniref:helix-turn-helix domain-containing protein n=1 Tax=Streptomyces sp. NPDC047123 TaxID=3155622 RepID=UPI0033C9BCDD